MFRRSHELGTHRIFYTVREDFIDVRTSLIVQVPSRDVIQRIKFTRMTDSPQRHGDSRLIKHPANRQGKHTLSVTLPRISLEEVHRSQVVLESRGLEFWVRFSKIVTFELRALVDSAT